MNRRQFIQFSYFFTSILAFSSLNCNNANEKDELLHKPEMLSEICSEEVILEIGLQYRRQTNIGKDENDWKNRILINLLGTKLLSDVSTSNLNKIILAKVQKDFEVGNYKIINGWIISETEAMQCALFSFSS